MKQQLQNVEIVNKFPSKIVGIHWLVVLLLIRESKLSR